jgi:hypothetical protein
MLHGGRIRGQGTYGCVFQPALLCRGADNSKLDPNKVGKITSGTDANNELEFAKYFESIPDATNYTIVPESTACIPRALSKQEDKDIQHCKFINTTPLSETKQILMPWGGYPLSHINLDPSFFDYYKFMEDLLAIGAFLIINDVSHFDIWGENLLFNSQNKPKLIDYGFAFRASELTYNHLRMRWREFGTDHDTETPEVTLMLGVQLNMSPHDVISDLRKNKPAVQRLITLCDLIPNNWESELLKWTNDSHSFQQHNWLNCWKVYWPGFDAWAIGAVLLNLLEIQLSIPAFTKGEQWKLKSEKVKKILRGLCRAHPAYRLDAVEALSIWTNGAHPLIADGSAGAAWIAQKLKTRPSF